MPPVERRSERAKNNSLMVLAFMTVAMLGLSIPGQVKATEARYRTTIDHSLAANITLLEGNPWDQCYPYEDMNYNHLGVEYPFPANLVIKLIPPLDPLRHTWTYYEEYLRNHSNPHPYLEGVYGSYAVPDIDGDGKVCGVCIGNEGARLLAPHYLSQTQLETFYQNYDWYINQLIPCQNPQAVDQ